MRDLLKHRKIGVRCYDNGGRSADRYTVVYTGRYGHLTGRQSFYVAMSAHPFHPQGIGLHGESRLPIDNRSWGQRGGYSHLGKKVSYDDLPDDCKKLVMQGCFNLATY